MILYKLWKNNLQQPDDNKKHFLTIESAGQCEVYKGYEDAKCLLHPAPLDVETIANGWLRQYPSKSL